MKRKIYFCFFSILLFISCSHKKNNNSNFAVTTPIIKTVGNIDVIVDPNLELMMILARLGQLTPYYKGFREENDYINEIDKYFGKFDLEPAVSLVGRSGLVYEKLPEFAMYMNEDSTGFKMELNNKHFITNLGPAYKYPFYALKSNMDAIRDFRIKTNFDQIFQEHKPFYEKMIDEKISIILEGSFDEWYKSFYGVKEKHNKCIYISYLSGANYGIEYKTSKGEIIPRSVILASFTGKSFIDLLSHELSHPMTRNVVLKLYNNETIKTFFDNQYKQNALYSHFVEKEGLKTGLSLLDETVNQACANKYLETVFSESEMKIINDYNVFEKRLSYMLVISDFLNVYENNRKKYKNFEAFYPELEKHILNIITEEKDINFKNDF